MTDFFSTPFKSASIPFQPKGVYVGVIQTVTGTILTVTVPRLSGDEVYENVEFVSSAFDSPPLVGERVVVTFHEGRQDELIALGRLASGTAVSLPVNAPDPKVGEILQWNGTAWVNGPAPVGDHGLLTGLLDDDHPQYALLSGLRSFTTLKVQGVEISPSAAATGQALVFDGTKFVPGAITGPTGATGVTGVTGTTGVSGAAGAAGAGYMATSTTSVVIGTGSKTFTTQAGLAYLAGDRVRVSSSATPTNFMEGAVDEECVEHRGRRGVVGVRDLRVMARESWPISDACWSNRGKKPSSRGIKRKRMSAL